MVSSRWAAVGLAEATLPARAVNRAPVAQPVRVALPATVEKRARAERPREAEAKSASTHAVATTSARPANTATARAACPIYVPRDRPVAPVT